MVWKSENNPDCCKGHFCDNCATCQKGRCCRTDNPHYKLPKLGEWVSVHGELGIFKDDIGGKAECHCCGNLYHHLGNHVWNSHNLTADEYRAVFGLCQSTGLISVELAEKRRENTDHLLKYRQKGIEKLKSFTPEQRKYFRGKDRLQIKKRPDYLPNKLQTLELAHKKLKKINEAKAVYIECDNCGQTFKQKRGQKDSEYKYCDQNCYAKSPQRKQLGIEAYERNLKS